MNKILLVAALLGITHGLAYYYGYKKPAQVITTEKQVVKRDVVTQIVEVTKPDGTKEVKTVITDKSKENKQVSILKTDKQWLVGAYYRVNDPAYGLQASRRILGPLFVIIGADTDRNLTIGLNYEF